jgi:fatty acid desaturase
LILYLGFPVLAAVLISQKDGARYLTEDGPRVTGWLRAVVAVITYLGILTDRLPGSSEPAVRFEVEPSGTPTPGSALLRILTAIPSAFILALLMFVSSIIWIIAAIWILIAETYPEPLYSFQRGIVRWTARLLAYLASLVDSYPPFSLDMGASE